MAQSRYASTEKEAQVLRLVLQITSLALPLARGGTTRRPTVAGRPGAFTLVSEEHLPRQKFLLLTFVSCLKC